MAAIFSPGDSIATVGVPNVTPSKEARAPPSEWPVIQMLASGYRYVRLLYRFYTHELVRRQGSESDTRDLQFR